MSGSANLQGGVTVHLLEASQGHSLQCWQFQDVSRITIGRADDRHIVIVDPYVSRSHVELYNDQGQWRLSSSGRHGVYVDGEAVSELELYDGLVFRLGASGPVLRFDQHLRQSQNTATLDMDSQRIMNLAIDKAKIDNDVGEIATKEYFQNLQQHARSLRQQRDRT